MLPHEAKIIHEFWFRCIQKARLSQYSAILLSATQFIKKLLV